MRSWRKVYASLLESEQVTSLSDGALNFFIFLIIGQDDSGYYPWNETKIRRLTATRPHWSRNDFDTWRNELVRALLITEQDGGVVLVNGAKLNGIPRSDLKAELYPRNETVTPRIETGTLEQSSGEGSGYLPLPAEQIKSRAEPPKSPAARGTRKVGLITLEFINLIVSEWSTKLGGEEKTREIIAEALNHKAMDKRKDKRLYLQGWLRREAERFGKEHTNGRTTTPTGGFDNSLDKYLQAAKSDPPPLHRPPGPSQ